MTRELDRVSTICYSLLLVLLTAATVAAADPTLAAGEASAATADGSAAPGGPVGAAADEMVEVALEPDEGLTSEGAASRLDGERQVETLEQKGGFIGYNFVATDGYGGRAQPYGFLRSSRSGGLFYRNLQKDTNLEIEGAFLNEHDYHGDLLVDYLGDYRLHLRTESLFHNLDRELLFPTSFPSATTAGTAANYGSSQDAPQDYGMSVVQDTADFRYRLHNYPLHVNLGYWRLVREGSKQQRFADVSFEAATDTPVTLNTVFAQRRDVDQQTQEGRLGVDAHLGPVDVIYDFKIRVFEDRLSTPVADYVSRNGISRNGLDPQLERVGGLHQHNEDPDSRFISNTIKLHSSLSGGLVTSGSYSFEQRENLSRLSDTTGAKHTTGNVQNAAGDVIYTPSQEYSLALKYRRQEVDYDNRTSISSNNFVDISLAKAHIDYTKDVITATLSYKPRRDFSVNGEYRGEFLTRNEVSATPSPTTWALPENSATHTGALTANYRPVTGVRLSANYNYATVDHPSYGASFEQKHEGRLLATYTRSSGWGGSANLIVRRENNDHVQHFLIKFPLDPLIYLPYPVTSRDRRVINGNLSGWVVPVERLTLGANYAYLQSQVDQAVLFTTVVSGSEAASSFTDRSHVYGVNAAYAFTDKFDLSLMLQQVRSDSAFRPQDTVFSSSSDTSGITDITRQNSVISYLSARGEYRFTPVVSSSLEYTVSDYDEKNSAYSAYNGTVHIVYATVAAKW